MEDVEKEDNAQGQRNDTDSKSSEDTAPKEVQHVRAGWGNKIEFFMAMLGSCVGLGSVWRFPYLCYSNGGGAFLVAYIFMVLLLGLPIFYLETSLGQFSNLSVLSVWKLSPIFKGVGIGALITAICITTYYNALIAQFLYYLILSMNSTLPWSFCDPSWATNCCQECLPNDTDCVPTRNVTDTSNCTKFNLPAEDFYNYAVLKISSGIDEFGYPVWQISLSLLACWVIVTLVLLRGATSFGKVAYVTAIFPYVMLFTMLIQGLLLPGAMKGIKYFIIPQWSKLLEPVVWSNAAGQVFFSLSTAYGQTIALASYNEFRHPLQRDATIIVLMTMFTAILSGFVVFSFLGFMAQEKNVELEDVVTAGPGLVFQVYPEALAAMPVATLWAILFFLMMLTLGFGSQFSQVETIQVAVQDQLSRFVKNSKQRKILLRITISAAMFLLGLPLTCNGGMYLLNLIDQSSGTFGLLFIALAECLIIPWVYGWDRFSDDIKMMEGKRPHKYFIICWGFVLPISLSVVLIMNFVEYKEPVYEDYYYPDWALAVGVIIMILPVVVIPIWSSYYYCWVMKGWVIAREGAKPAVGWGPSRPDDYNVYMHTLAPRNNRFQTSEDTAKAYSEAVLEEKALQIQETDYPEKVNEGYTEMHEIPDLQEHSF